MYELVWYGESLLQSLGIRTIWRSRIPEVPPRMLRFPRGFVNFYKFEGRIWRLFVAHSKVNVRYGKVMCTAMTFHEVVFLNERLPRPPHPPAETKTYKRQRALN